MPAIHLDRHLSAISRRWPWNRPKRLKAKQKATQSAADYHLSAAEVKEIINAVLSPRNRLIIRMLAETGMRRAELVGLHIQDIESSGPLLRIRHGKGNKTRVIPITESLHQAILRYINDRLDGPILLSRHGGGLSSRQINRIVSEAGRKAGITNPNPDSENVTCHLFRHTFARLWKARGGSIESLSRVMGHSSVKTTWDLYGREGLADVIANYRAVIGQIFDGPENETSRENTKKDNKSTARSES